MALTHTEDSAMTTLSPERCEASVIECLEAAMGLAQFTHFPIVHPAHIALALLGGEQNILDPLLKERFAGLQATTVAESLLEVLEIAADTFGSEAGNFPSQGLPKEQHCSTEAWALLQRADELTMTWGLARIPLQAVAGATFAQPEHFITEAFQDAGVSLHDLASLAEHLLSLRAQTEWVTSPTVFIEDGVNVEAFGTVTQTALRELAQLAAAQPARNLRDTDLLSCLLGHESSLLMQALHVMGMPVASIRRYLSTVVENTGTTKAVTNLPIKRMSRLLQRVFKEAAELAGQEHCALISESHLIRAHLDRVAGATDNLYQRLRIDTSRLRQYLTQYKTDRLPSETQQQAEGIEDIEGYLLSRVINQEHAVRSVVPALRRMRIGLSESGRPIGVFLFLGPTGVGKTELSRAIADVIFGPKPGVRDPYLITLNCGDYVNKWDIVRLIGATQGLVGYDEGGQLINGLRAKPKSVILFDEAEKAHPDVWQSLLPLFDEGIVREANGTGHDATGCVIVATSNLGYKDAIQQFNLWQITPEQRTAVQRDVEEFVWMRIQDYFSPEFRGRFGRENIIFFNHFDLSNYQAIVHLQVKMLIDEMEGRGLTVKVDESVINSLADLAWQGREEGARPVRRLVTIHLRDQLVRARTDDPQRTLFSFTVLTGSGKVVLES